MICNQLKKVRKNEKSANKKTWKRIGAMMGSLMMAMNVICANSVYTQAANVTNQEISATGEISEKMALNPSLSANKVTVNVGKTKKIKVKNASESVEWSSKNKKIASVSKNGVIKGKKAGKTSVIAKVSGKELVCKVTVVKKITKNQAIKMVQKELGTDFAYFCGDEIVSYKGKKYYVVYVQVLVNGDHYSTVTQYLVSTDGKVCREGYCYGDDIGFY